LIVHRYNEQIFPDHRGILQKILTNSLKDPDKFFKRSWWI